MEQQQMKDNASRMPADMTAVNIGLLLMRVALGLVFIVHGGQKLANIGGTSVFFSQLGLNAFFVYLVTFVELLGGIAVLFGLFTKWAGILLAINMFFAIYLVKLNVGFLGGYEFDLVLLLTALAVSLIGPGKYSISRMASGS